MNLRRSVGAIGVAIAVGLGLVGCGSSSAVPEARADLSGPVDLGNGRSIHMECRGSGSPTVVLVSGLGDRADTWMATSGAPTSPEGSVFRGVEGVTRVCAYDRPGTATATEGGLEPSRSTPVDRPATVADSAADLDLLLAASGEPGPYVLVGHSLGGPIVRLFAAAHSDQVAGLVFVDALSEDLGNGLTPEQVVSFEALNDPVTQGLPAGSEQAFYAAAVVPLMRAAAPAPVVPTVILTADQWPFTASVIDAGHQSGAIPAFVTLELTDALWAAQLPAQAGFAALFPSSEHVTDTQSAHYIHRENPRLVIESIVDVVGLVRAGSVGPGTSVRP